MTPKDRVWRHDNLVVYRYRGGERTQPSPVVLVPSLVSRAYLFDLMPGSSLVADLLAAGFDVYLIDWGVPGYADANNTLATYSDAYLPAAIRSVVRSAEADEVNLIAHCFGAVLTLLSLAGNPQLPVRRAIAMATPIDFSKLGPMAELAASRLDPEDLLDRTGNLPPERLVRGFQLTKPTGALRTYLSLWRSLEHEQLLGAHQVMTRWFSDHIPLPGGVAREIVELFIRRDLLTTGTVPVGDRDLALGDIACPVLSVLGATDDIVPPIASAPLRQALAGAQVEHLTLPAGHAGLFVGRRARTDCVPRMIDWLRAA